MPKFNINKFKGLRQDIDYPELPLEYCHTLHNLNVDDPVGVLSIRGGSVKKYNSALSGYPFSGLVSAFEYRFEVSSETVLIVNDNGTLKTMTDGGAPASLTLPTGAAMEGSFQNYYLGYRDHILITTGNAATNYILWFGYLDRENDDNTGLFGNNEEFTGYKLLKSQLSSPHGMFGQIHNITYLDSFYYVSFDGSSYIEKRDTDFHLVERFLAHPDASAKSTIALDSNETSGKIYMGTEDGIYEVEPNGWVIENSLTTPSGILGIDNDGTFVYSITASRVDKITIATWLSAINVAVTAGTDICYVDSNIFVLADHIVTKRAIADLLVDDTSSDYTANTKHIEAQSATYILLSSTTGSGHVYQLLAADCTENADVEDVLNPSEFVWVGGQAAGTLRVISSFNGTVQNWDTGDLIYPEMFSLCNNSISSGAIGVGTYFYKISTVDTDGQETVLSDPIIVINTAADKQINLVITANKDNLTGSNALLYRVQYVNIYRAFSETEDADVPSTDYKFLKQIDINSSNWTEDTAADTAGYYYYTHSDNIDEDTISTTTFLESSGIGDTVRPRYVNGKYFTFINNQLHLANFGHDGETYRNRILRSADNAPDALSFYDFYDFDVGVGEAINGITEMFGRAIIFKERKMGVYYDGRWERTFEPGAHNSHAFYKVNDILYYVSLKGMHAFDGSKLINIHYPVITFFDDVDKDDNPPNVFYVDGKNRIYFSMRDQRVLVLNTKHNTWTQYSGSIAFFGYFKNYVGEYIGWDSTDFFVFEDGESVNDDEDFGGGNGDTIGLRYLSPLIRFSNVEGEVGIPISHRHRILKDTAVDAVNRVRFVAWEYQDDASGRTSRYTQNLDSPGGSQAATKNYFFGPFVGESFQFELTGAIDGGNFKYHGITIDYMPGGYWRGR